MSEAFVDMPRAAVVARLSLALLADGLWGADEESFSDPAVAEWFRKHGFSCVSVAPGAHGFVPESATVFAIHPSKDAIRPTFVGG